MPEQPRITLEPLARPVEIRYERARIARSDDVLCLTERGYPPRLYLADLAWADARLVESSTHTHCPFKGDAIYFDLLVGRHRLADAAWCYPEPIADMAALAGRLAFDHPGLEIA